MVRYVDTCGLLSLFFRDSGTQAALSWLEARGNDPIATSHWALTEFVSAAGIMARRGELSAELHREGIARLRRFCAARLTPMALAQARSHLTLLVPDELIFQDLSGLHEKVCLLRSSLDGTRLDAVGASG